MRLSSLNIFKTWNARNAQQQQEVKENSAGPKRVWKKWEYRIWGHNMSWTTWDERRLTGHTTPLPKVGDELLDRLHKGTARFEFVEVQYCGDPSDMWFAKVRDMGYVRENEIA